ncbi:MAG: sulfotransferase [Phycisphaerales bacterium]|nr:sulfotransferase [Phycisphaerales bacterium]
MSSEQDRLVRQQISSLLYGGDVAAAESLCQQHLRSRARDHEAMALLAHIHLTAGRFRDAEATLSRAIALDAKRADYQALMAEILTTTGRHREALGRYDKALKIRSDFEAALAGKADTYLRMGKPDKALRVVSDSPRPSSESALLAIVQARALIRDGQYDEAESVARQHLPGDELIIEHRRSLWFVAAQAAERRGDLDGAAETYRQANALSEDDWDPEASTTARAAAREIFTDAERLPRSDCREDRPVFIVGMLRSGSTLAEQIIAAHPDAAGLGEIDTLPTLAATLQEVLGTALPYPACLQETNELSLTGVARAYLDETRGMAPKAHCRVDKQLGNFCFLGLISLLFPNARVIHCRRHPMDMGLSCWTQKFAPGTTGWSSTLEGIAGFHREYEAWMDLWSEVLPMTVLEVRYEDLVADLEGQTRRLLEFCDLEWDDRCLKFWETKRTVLTLSSDQVRQPLYGRSVGRHAQWGSRLSPLRDAMGDSIERYESGPI